MRFEVRKTWRNHTGNQRIEPLRIYEPETVDEVVGLVREAEKPPSSRPSQGLTSKCRDSSAEA